jgi:hypothetical protein
MNRVSIILALWAILSVLAAPLLLASDHHETGFATEHVACDGDCGCMCHIGLTGVVKSDVHESPLPVARALDYYCHPRTPDFISSLDRPPELFS